MKAVDPVKGRWVWCAAMVLAAMMTTSCGASRSPEPSSRESPHVESVSPEPGATRTYVSLESISDEGDAVTIRWAEVFWNEEATAAAIEDGVILPGQDLPNPMYVRDSDETATFRLTPETRVVLLGFDDHGSPIHVSVSVGGFVDAFRAGFPTSEWAGGTHAHYRVEFEEERLMLVRQVVLI
jgi:hypothetical protein